MKLKTNIIGFISSMMAVSKEGFPFLLLLCILSQYNLKPGDKMKLQGLPFKLVSAITFILSRLLKQCS